MRIKNEFGEVHLKREERKYLIIGKLCYLYFACICKVANFDRDEQMFKFEGFYTYPDHQKMNI